MSRATTAGPPLPPALPEGRVLLLPGRGEALVRRAPGPAGAPRVLLLHGWTATADVNFFPAYGPLAEVAEVVALDQRAHGRGILDEGASGIEAMADDAAALLDLLGGDPAVVVGYSMGGAVAQLLADRRPDLVAGIVLAATAARFDDRLGSKVTTRLTGWSASARKLSVGRTFAHLLADRAERHAAEVAPLRPWLVAELERGHGGEQRAAGRSLLRFDGRAIAERLRGRIPVASVVTVRDHLVPRARQEASADAWGAPVVRLDADHDAPATHPSAFAAALVEAVGSVVARTAAAAA